ncbi:MAG: TetR/AcrR family transcriptional regulator [Aquiluna sp.]
MTGTTTAGEKTARAIREKATELIFLHGFEATSLRQIAASVGVKVGSLYNHINGKEDLLLQIMGSTMDELMVAQEAALAREVDVIDKIIVLLEVHIRFHAEHAQVVFIGNSEIRSLSGESRSKITNRRREYQKMIAGVLEDAHRDGRAHVIDARRHTIANLAMGAHVASWFNPRGSASLESIIDAYSKITLRGLGIDNADQLVDARKTSRS